MRYISTILALLVPFWLPWPLVLLVLCGVAVYEPLAAVAGGVLADALYFTHGAYSFPFMSLCSVFIAVGALLVRKFLETRIM